MYHEHEYMTFLLYATYTKILIYIEKSEKKSLGPGPRAPMVATPMLSYGVTRHLLLTWIISLCHIFYLIFLYKPHNPIHQGLALLTLSWDKNMDN